MIDKKHQMLKKLLGELELDGILITRQDNFSWFSGGNNYVNIASQKGMCQLLVTRDNIYLISNNIEAPRILDEEINNSVIDSREFNWYESEEPEIKDIIKDGRLGSDSIMEDTRFLGKEFDCLRSVLTDREIESYRMLAQDSARALEKICYQVKRGESELEIAGKISRELYNRGVVPIVLLVAADDRIYKYRHPLPTKNKLKRQALLVICGRRDGLVVSASRLLYFGKLPEELRDKHQAVVEIDAKLIESTKPGEKVSDIFSNIVDFYQQTDYKDEWQLHHQGGLTGYNTREYLATPANQKRVQVNQAFAWNPSIAGTKEEDTIIVGEEGNEIITETGDFPYCEINVDGKLIKRPDILLR